MSAKPRVISQRIAKGGIYSGFRDLYRRVEEEGIGSWVQVEDEYIEAMWRFDQSVTKGEAGQGDVQNGKGDFLTDLLALLLENASGKKLWGRGKVPGLFYRGHFLDAFYPPTGTVEVLVETKAAGAPPNPRQRTPKARPASQDLKKRITELAFKTIDLKAESARGRGQGDGPAGDLKTWLNRSNPMCALFMAIRIADEQDLRATLSHARVAKEILNHVGLVAYGPTEDNGRYVQLPLPTDLELDRALSQVATHLRQLH